MFSSRVNNLPETPRLSSSGGLTWILSSLFLMPVAGLCFAAECLANEVPGDLIKNLPAGHWYEIPDSKLAGMDPCPQRNCSYSAIEGLSAVMNDWSGGAFDSKGNRLIAWGGGHQGYAGNEVYAFDVLGSRKWERLSEPSKDVSCDQTKGLYPDGNPCSAHTYDYVDFHPGSNSFIKLGSASNYPDGGAGIGTVNFFSLTTRKWRNGATLPLGSGALIGASSAYDPKRDVFWLLPAYDQPLAKYDPNAGNGDGKWTAYNPYNIDIDAVSAIDPERNLFVTLDAHSKHQVIVHDLNHPEAGGEVVKTQGAKKLESVEAAGFEWDPAIKKFVGWGGGTSVYTLDPKDWRWTRITAAADNTVTPTAPNANGTFGRFRYMPDLNAFIVVNHIEENVFVYKLGDGTGAGAGAEDDQDSHDAAPSAAADEKAASSDDDLAPPSGEIKTVADADEPPFAQETLPIDPTENFMARAKAPGVVFYEGFDSDAVIKAKQNPEESGGRDHILYDTDQKVSGKGALEFVIPSKSPADSSGSWRTNFSDDASIKFGAGENLYIQWRQRFDSAMLNTVYKYTDGTNGGWKTILIGEGDYPGFQYGRHGETGSCTTMHIVMHNNLQRTIPMLYHSCGTYEGLTPTFKGEDGTYYKLQNAIDRGKNVTPVQDRFVLYGFEPEAVSHLRPESPAVGFYPDEWMTFQIRISPGPLGTAIDPLTNTVASGFTKSTVEMWVAREGKPSIKTHSLTGLVLRRNDGAKDTGEKYGKVWFTPYQTNKDPSQETPVAHTWIDELIVSRNRIQDP